MAAVAQVIKSVAAVGWPLLTFIIFFCMRKQIASVLDSLAKQISSGARFKYGELEFTGVDVFERTDEELRGNEVEKYAATNEQAAARDLVYENNRSLFLIHKIRHSVARGTKNADGKRYDIELSLHSHKGRTNLNVVSHVEYYFGHYFGREPGAPNGSCYRVEDPTGGFAIVTSAYGEFLCAAKVHFYDGSEAELQRYVDFAMSPVLPPPADGVKAK